jgi:hypothetical protein
MKWIISSSSSLRPDSIIALAKDGSFDIGVFASPCQTLASYNREKGIRVEQLPEPRNITYLLTHDDRQPSFNEGGGYLSMYVDLDDAKDHLEKLAYVKNDTFRSLAQWNKRRNRQGDEMATS